MTNDVMYKKFFKRFLDIIFSFLILLLLTTILLIISLLVLLSSSGPIFFTQNRLGKNAIVFKLYKFRTMTNKERKVDHEIFADDPEVTSIGRFLRRFKIDELPQLINVLTGNLSLVGPRPGMPEQLKDLDENGIKRLKVLPGLTGLAQVNGNIYLEWPERWKYDRYYVENISFMLDIKIIFKTVRIIFRGEKKFVNKPIKYQS